VPTNPEGGAAEAFGAVSVAHIAAKTSVTRRTRARRLADVGWRTREAVRVVRELKSDPGS
jgi:hypothetical protein